MADEDNIKRIPINQLRQEDGAHELAISPDMEPYLDFIKAVIPDHDPSSELGAIRQLPLEKALRMADSVGSKMGPCRLR